MKVVPCRYCPRCFPPDVVEAHEARCYAELRKVLGRLAPPPVPGGEEN